MFTNMAVTCKNYVIFYSYVYSVAGIWLGVCIRSRFMIDGIRIVHLPRSASKRIFWYSHSQNGYYATTLASVRKRTVKLTYISEFGKLR